MSTHYLVIGNGIAGVSAAEEIRRHSPRSAITIVSDEPYPMYSRPGLAYLLTGEISESTIFCRSRQDYAERRLHLVHGRVRSLDPSRHEVHLDDGDLLIYDRLLLATGAAAVPVPFSGKDLKGLVTLDTLSNVQDVLNHIQHRAQSAVVVGGGITAMEMAEGLCRRGIEVHYVLRKKGIWSTLLTEAESRIMESRALEHGIQLYFDQGIEQIIGANGRVVGVRTTRGQFIPCQLVGAAIGVRPNLDIVKETGIRMDRGIVVDEFLQSSVPGIFAAGDVAQAFDPWTGESRLDMLWHSAQAMGRTAGANMTGARQTYVPTVPFNAARLFGVHMTCIGRVGAPEHGDRRAIPDGGECSRGSSDGWWADSDGFYQTACYASRKDAVRLILHQNQIAGALILGDQSATAALQDLITERVDITSIRSRLEHGGPELGQIIQSYYEQKYAAEGTPR